ncbi:hypothetical protein ACLGGT_21495 [Roseovarius sp. MS2]|uniref:hypothetical protein n=1 Tax=Roseovarius sp. MS2 TaxID=3390728 RepID=UPI003EDC916E
MLDFYLLARFKLGSWMLHRSLDVMPRCSLRDTLRMAVAQAYAFEREQFETPPSTGE